jgi:prepilin-type N-terminal cleavage/methylation domain-containing protein
MRSAFTLIELLVVVAILGILVVVLSAFDPLEQILRGRDSGRVAIVSQIHEAYVRIESLGQRPLSDAYVGATLSSSEGQEALSVLLNYAEIKHALTEHKNLDDIYLSYDPTLHQLKLCFLLESEGFTKQWERQFSESGERKDDCETQDCFACLDAFTQRRHTAATYDSLVLAPSTTPSPSPSPTPTTAQWFRATSGNNCNDFCAQQGMMCSNQPGTCQPNCGSTAGYAQIEATWAGGPNTPRDPITNQTCWGAGPCGTQFQYQPLWAFNARCCCQ